MVLVSLSVGSINMLAYEDTFVDIYEEKVYANATVDQSFADSRVLVMFNNEESLKFKDYQRSDFPEINCKGVIDLSYAYSQKVKNIITEIQTISILSGHSGRNAENIEIINKYNQILCLELENAGKENVIAAIKALQKRDDILYVGPDYEIIISDSIEDYEPDDPNYDDQWAAEKIELPKAWQLIENMSYGEVHEVVVGVLDTGIDGYHPDLEDIIDVSSSRNFTDGSADYVNTVIDDNGHGTHVAGIIGAIGDNGKYIAGTCWDVKLVSLKVFDSNGKGYASHLISAIEYVIEDTDIQILNFSGGFSGTETDSIGNYWLQTEDIPPLKDAIERFDGLFVCSAGNNNSNNDISSRYPASFIIDNMITVGASTSQDEKRTDSNFGYNTVDLFAPGDNIYSLWKNGNCTSMGGTSMAAPFVTGVAALILSVNPNIETDKLKQYILDNVDDVSDDVTAFQGICQSNGRLNAYKALYEVLNCQHGGSNTYAQNDQTSHIVCCGNCGHNLYAEGHSRTYTNTNTINHTVSCTKCSYSFTEKHERYVESVYDDGCTIACGSCSYSFDCDCTPNYRKFNSSVHWVDCPDGEFSFSEEHNFDYLWLLPSDSSRLFYHNAVCADCGGSYRLAHNWESVFGGGVECSDCGLESNIGGVGNVMSLSEEELELLLSSMSEEELGEFIAALPEDQLARVTAMLPPVNDDELLTE